MHTKRRSAVNLEPNLSVNLQQNFHYVHNTFLNAAWRENLCEGLNIFFIHEGTLNGEKIQMGADNFFLQWRGLGALGGLGNLAVQGGRNSRGLRPRQELLEYWIQPTCFFIGMYFMKILRLKFVENVRISQECSKAHIQISLEIFLCTYIKNGDVGCLYQTYTSKHF